MRSNLIIVHLNGHTKGQANTSKDFVNPDPSIGNSKLVFNKMINLSASSCDAINTEKVNIFFFYYFYTKFVLGTFPFYKW